MVIQSRESTVLISYSYYIYFFKMTTWLDSNFILVFLSRVGCLVRQCPC